MAKAKKPAAKRLQIKSSALYRAQLTCKVGRDVVTGEREPPFGSTREEYALYCLLHSIEEIARHLEQIK